MSVVRAGNVSWEVLIAGKNGIDDDDMQSTIELLVAKLLCHVPSPGRFLSAANGLVLTRWNDVNQTDYCFYAPAIGLILQGRKESVIGSEKFTYGALDCLVNGVDMPSMSRIIEATPENPLLAVSFNIDRALAAEVVAEMPPAPDDGRPGVSVAKVTPDVLDAFSRLVDMLDKPEQAPFMTSLLIREIIGRVLVGPQGPALRMIHTRGTHSYQIAGAITWLRENYTTPLHVEALAGWAGMATSTFHRQFKKVTSISPLQFQKCLRLYEAQRLMLVEDMDANNAARAVGYDNIQQFTREYKRMFGEPPYRDIKRLRRE